MPIQAIDLCAAEHSVNAKLELLGVHKSFGEEGRDAVVALDGFDLFAQGNDFLCLLGPSGCGKTTVLNIVAGFERPTSGQVLIWGRPVVGPGADRAVVFQQGSLFTWMTVLENVAFGPRCLGRPLEESRRLAQENLSLVGLSGFEQRYPYELSGGMQQRVGIARVLANNPKSLLMDEPFAALDAQTRELLLQEIKTIWQRTKKMVLWITHSIDEALFLATKLVVMTARPGRIKASFACDFGNEVDFRLVTSSDFTHAKKQLLEVLHDEAVRAQYQDRRTG